MEQTSYLYRLGVLIYCAKIYIVQKKATSELLVVSKSEKTKYTLISRE
jgi:hypothetical protein